MVGKLIDRVEARLAPHARLISILAGIWFWFGIALQSGFVRLPEIPWLPKAVVFWGGVVANAVWWGFLYPAITERRKAREAAGP